MSGDKPYWNEEYCEDINMSDIEKLTAQVATMSAQMRALMQRQWSTEQHAAERVAAAASNGHADNDANVRVMLEQHKVMFNEIMHQQANIRVAMEQQTVAFNKMMNQLAETKHENKVGVKNLIDKETVEKPQTFGGQKEEFRS